MFEFVIIVVDFVLILDLIMFILIFIFVFVRKVFEVLGDNLNIVILGNDIVSWLLIFFIIIYYYDSGKFVYYNFVFVFLNDFYGI